MTDQAIESQAEETGAEVAQVSADELNRLSVFYNPDLDFKRLALEAQYRSKGFRLVSKELLKGVPHVIIGVTYREGYPRGGKPGDYISIEAIVADQYTLNSRPVRSQIEGELAVYGNEPVVYNDSGTGIRRELTRIFHEAGMINVGTVKDDTAFDRQYQQWKEGADRATTGIVADVNGEPFRYLAMRGLRLSEYESPYGPAETYYLG